ncbi:MAG: formylglycine-generating enzyme family protein [Deltaproteobacteria bacterium]|nr:formylglycine-generating enzyme family protein [Deltaproteobacteria bacterium]
MDDTTQIEKRTFVMTRIPAGFFTMGSRPGQGEEDEFPEHQIWIDELLIARFPVTASEWARFLNETGDPDGIFFEPSSETTVVLVEGKYHARRGCGRYPASGLSWYGAVAYCQWLSEKTGRVYRLPTEAEWEKAARGNRERMCYPWWNDLPGGMAQFNQQWVDPLHTLSEVDSYPPNPFGLHDMVGNVWEWCSDFYDAQYYQRSPERNPTGPEDGRMKVVRGGSWRCIEVQIRTGIRLGEWPSSTSSGIGFRLARSID